MRREATGTTSYTEAVRQLKSRQGQIAEGRRVEPTRDRFTFDRLAAGLVMITGRKAAARSSASKMRSTSPGHVQRVPRPRDRRGLVTKYIVERQAETAANATINRELAALKRMYRLAEERLGGYHPTIRMLEEDNIRRGFFERPQLEALLAHLPEELHPAIRAATSPAGGSSRSCSRASGIISISTPGGSPGAGRDEESQGTHVPAGPGAPQRARAAARRDPRVRAAHGLGGTVALPPGGATHPLVPPELGDGPDEGRPGRSDPA